MPDKSSNVPFSIVFPATGAEPLSITRVSNNPDSFLKTTKRFIPHISRQRVSNAKIKRITLKFFNICKGDFNNVVKVNKNC